MSQVLREHAIGMLTAGMSPGTVARELNVHFSIISRLQCNFREIGSTSKLPQNRCPRETTPAQDLHIQLLHLRDGRRPCTRTADETVGLHNWRISAQTVRNHLRWGKLICVLVVLTRVLTWLQFCVVTDFSRQMLIFDGHWHTGEVCSSWMNPGFNCTEQYGVVWATGLLMSTLWIECGGVMVWAWISYRQQTQLHFIDGNLNAQRYRDKMPRHIVVPLIRCHHLMFQHDIARTHDARVFTQFLAAENVPVLPWPAPDMSPVEHVWDALDRCVRQRVYSSHQYAATSHVHWREVGQQFHRPHSTACSTLNEGGHTRHWLVFWSAPLPFILGILWPTDTYLYSQSCGIHRLGPN